MYEVYLCGLWIYVFLCPSLLSVSVIKHHEQKHLGDENVYLAHTSMSQSIIVGSQGRNPSWSSGRNRGEMLLTGFATYGLLSLLSYISQDYLPRGHTTYCGRGLSKSINYRKCPTDSPGGNFLSWDSFFLGVKLTKFNQRMLCMYVFEVLLCKCGLESSTVN